MTYVHNGSNADESAAAFIARNIDCWT